jgi:transcriptional regulator with XRE-family HTH domain
MKEQAVFGRNLKALRKKRGLTQAKLAEMLGVSTVYIYYLEAARKSPSFELIIRIHRVLKCSHTDLYKGLL